MPVVPGEARSRVLPGFATALFHLPMKHLFILRISFAGVLLAVPLSALAVTVTVNSLIVPMGKNYTVDGSFSTFTLDGRVLTATLAASETLTITSPDNTKFTFDTSLVPSRTESCTASSYAITFTNPAGASTKTFTVTPIATTCAVSSSGGAGGGGSGGAGGGGSSSAATPPPAVSPTPPPPAVTPPPPAPVPVFGIVSDLARGSQGAEVSQLQAYLASDPSVYPEGKITGYFGPATKAAVQRFQKKYGIAAIGRVGLKTRAKLQEIFGTPSPAPAPPAGGAPGATGGAITHTLARGSSGNDVTTLQTYLATDPALYPEGTVSGFFGPATERALKRFQAKYGITQLGRVGPATMAKLNQLLGASGAPALPPAPPPPAQSMSADDAAKIKALQDQLKALNDQLKGLQSQ